MTTDTAPTSFSALLAVGLGACCLVPLVLGVGLSLGAGIALGSGLLAIAGLLASLLWWLRRMARSAPRSRVHAD